MVGCGFVGSSSCFALMQSGLFSEMVLIDAFPEKAEGEALDMAHGLPFARPMNIYAGTYDDIADAAIVIVTAGAAQKPGETRLDLVKKNVGIFKSIIPEIATRNKEGIMLIVANPVDVLTYAALKISGWSENRVLGTGTVLDTARLKYLVGNHLNVDSRNIHAFVVGEHGDSEVAAWSSARVSNVPIKDFCEMRGYPDQTEYFKETAEEVKNSAYEIIQKKRATYYGIAMSVKRCCEAIVRDEKSVLPVSSLMYGVHDIEGLCLSMPAIVGASGVECLVPVDLNEEEFAAVKKSAAALKEVIADALPEYV